MRSPHPPPCPPPRKQIGATRANIRMADNHWRSPPPPPLDPPPPPTPKTKVTIVGKNQIYDWENLIGPFLVCKLLGPRPRPSLSSNASLGAPIHPSWSLVKLGAGTHGGAVAWMPGVPHGTTWQSLMEPTPLCPQVMATVQCPSSPSSLMPFHLPLCWQPWRSQWPHKSREAPGSGGPCGIARH